MISCYAERFPAKPYIKEGYPKNITALVNSTVKFECPQILTDLEPYIQWIYTKTYPDGLSNFTKPTGYNLSNLSQLEVVKVLEKYIQCIYVYVIDIENKADLYRTHFLKYYLYFFSSERKEQVTFIFYIASGFMVKDFYIMSAKVMELYITQNIYTVSDTIYTSIRLIYLHICTYVYYVGTHLYIR